VDSNPLKSLSENSQASPRWFESLPVEHQDRMVQEDAARLDRWDQIYRKGQASSRHAALESAALFGCIGAMVTLMSPLGIVTALLAGATSGIICHVAGAEELLSPVIAVLLFATSLYFVGELNGMGLIWAPAPISVVSYFLGQRRSEIVPR
jgi:hypothetical protein